MIDSLDAIVANLQAHIAEMGDHEAIYAEPDFSSMSEREVARHFLDQPELTRELAWLSFCDEPLRYSEGANAYANFKNLDGTARSVRDKLLSNPIVLSDKLLTPAYSGAVLISDGPPPAGKRKNIFDENIDFISMKVLDCDEFFPGIGPEEVSRALADRGIAHVVASTYSSAAEKRKCRIVLFLTKPIPVRTPEQRDHYRACYKRFGAWLGTEIDPKCANPSRIFFYRSHNGKTPSFAWFVPGERFDFDAWAATQPIAEPKQSRPRRERTTAADYETTWMPKFTARHWKNFDAHAYVVENVEDADDKGDGRADLPCPFAEDHNTPDPDGARTMYVIQRDVAQHGVETVGCNHTHCDYPGPRYIEAVAGSLGDGYADLLAYVDGYQLKVEQWRERLREAQAAVDAWKGSEALGADVMALEAAIMALGGKDQVTAADVKPLIRALATRAVDFDTTRLIPLLSKKSGMPQPALKSSIKSDREQRDAALAALADVQAQGERLDEDADGPSEAPAEGDEQTVSAVRAEWDHRDQVRVALCHLQANSDGLYERPEGGAVRTRGEPGSIRTEALTRDSWAAEVNARVEYRRFTDKTGDRGCPIPETVISEIRGSAQLAFSVLERVVHVPVFASDGTLMTAAGYDSARQVYHDPNFKPLPLPDRISRQHVEAAVALLTEAIQDFPFSDAFSGQDANPVKVGAADERGYRLTNPQRGVSSRAHALAAILQPFARDLIDGPCPTYLVDKVKPGEGAGYLADVVSFIVEGKRATPSPVSTNEDEVRKAATAVAVERRELVFYDNVNHLLAGGALASFMTATTWNDRVLGATATTGDVPIKHLSILGANKLDMDSEFVRRLLPIRLDSAVPRPEKRPPSDFNHYPLHDWLMQSRAQLVHACHVIIGYWVQEGMKPGRGHMASFDGYARVMSGILGAAGVEGFLGNVEDFCANRDAQVEDDDEGFDMIAKVFGLSKDFTPRDLATLWAPDGQYTGPWPLSEKGSIEKSLGKALRKRKGDTVTVAINDKAIVVKLVQKRDRNPSRWHLWPVPQGKDGDGPVSA